MAQYEMGGVNNCDNMTEKHGMEFEITWGRLKVFKNDRDCGQYYDLS